MPTIPGNDWYKTKETVVDQNFERIFKRVAGLVPSYISDDDPSDVSPGQEPSPGSTGEISDAGHTHELVMDEEREQADAIIDECSKIYLLLCHLADDEVSVIDAMKVSGFSDPSALLIATLRNRMLLERLVS